jgi:hypothetical protein
MNLKADINEEDILDESWIKNFEKIDRLYEDFYKDNIYYININIIYVNKENTIEKINQELFIMQKPNIISREEIIGIIKRNSTINDTLINKYSFLTMIKYNFVLNPEDVTTFLKTKEIDYYNSQFFTILKNVDSVDFEKTINMFQDLNTLFIIFYEKDKNIKDNNIIVNSNNCTKKIYLRGSNPKNKKTLRR